MIKLFLSILIALMLTVNLHGFATTPNLQLAVTSATYQPVAQRKVVDGVVEAVHQALLTAQTTGQVLEINFDVDDMVEKDEVLIRLKNVEQQSSLAQLQAQLNEATAVLNASQKEYYRIKQLYDKHLISLAASDKAQADLAVAEARLNNVQSSLKRANEQVEYTEIRAPYNGIVLKRYIQVGEIARAGQPIMEGFSLEELRVVATVPQSQLDTILQHKTVEISLMGKSGDEDKPRLLEGSKITMVPHADTATHSFKLRIDLPVGIENVYPGMFAKVAFILGQTPRLMVPASAVAYRGEVRAVYVVNQEGQVSMRYVRLGNPYGNRIEIVSGLNQGESIAINPVDATIILKNQRAKILADTAATTESH